LSEKKRFQGFFPETVTFFESLKNNNNKKWFEAHRKEYETYVKHPSQEFVVAMGKRLRERFPGIHAVPKVNKSLFRISRDTRFSPDKSPYKPYMGIFFWEGSRPRMECSGFYLHLEPPGLLLGVGIYMFPKYLMDTFRNSVVNPKYGKELTAILKKITQKGEYTLGGKHYKRTPAGYDSGHPNADLLLYNGLHAGQQTPLPKEFYTPKLVDYCWERYFPLVPLHGWLVAMTQRYLSRPI